MPSLTHYINLVLSHFHSGLAVHLALGWPSIATRVLIGWMLKDSICHDFYCCLSETSDDGTPQLLNDRSFIEGLEGFIRNKGDS